MSTARRPRRHARSLSLVAGLSFLGRIASADAPAVQPPSIPPAASPTAPASPRTEGAPDADRLFHEGRAAADAGDFQTALERFQGSERLDPAAGTLLNVAIAEEHVGRVVEAAEHYRLAASGFKRDDRRHQIAMRGVVSASASIARLTLSALPSLPVDAVVTRDGRRLDRGAFGVETDVDPGLIIVHVEVAGHVPRDLSIRLEPGARAALTVESGASIATLPPAPVAESHKGTHRRVIGVVVAGVGGAGLATGALFGALAWHDSSVVKRNCDAAYACNGAGLNAASSGSAYSTVSDVAFIAGGILAGAGLAIVLSTLPRSSDRPSAAASLRITQCATGRGMGGCASWVF